MPAESASHSHTSPAAALSARAVLHRRHLVRDEKHQNTDKIDPTDSHGSASLYLIRADPSNRFNPCSIIVAASPRYESMMEGR
jgi:hypothetical protein